MVSIVIIGGSFGGLTTAFELKRLLGRKHEITIVSDTDTFVFIPSLPWLALGLRKTRDIIIKLKLLLDKGDIGFIHAAAERIDPEKGIVYTTSGLVHYDYLIIATGAYLEFEAVPGLGPDKYTDCICTLEHAEKAHHSWKRFIEGLGPIVIGSAQGVSCFGPAYEFAFEIDSIVRRLRKKHKVPMFFITSEPYVGHFGIAGLRNSKRLMEDEFAERDIKVIPNVAIEEITPGNIKLKDGTVLPFKYSMIVPAFKGVKAVEISGLGNPRAFLPVDEFYRHTKYKNIYAVGVSVAIAPPEQTPVPTGVPKTGNMTVKMAKKSCKTHPF